MDFLEYDDADETLNDEPDNIEYQNGPTAFGTFVGTCGTCGTTWEFGSYEVIPAPYPHGTCPNCHQWVAVF